jgi:hypothetical protein
MLFYDGLPLAGDVHRDIGDERFSRLFNRRAQ